MLEKAWIIVCFLAIALGVNTESTCYSRFDYEEKLLMKLVKIEHQIDILNSEKAERKREFEIEIEEFKEKGAEEILKQRNLTTTLAKTLNSEIIERMKSFASRIRKFREKSSKEMQKQNDITSELLEVKTDRMKLFETEMEDFRQQMASGIQKSKNLNALLYENLTSEKSKRVRSFDAEMEKFRKENAKEIQNQRNMSAMLQVNDTLLNFLRAPVVVFTVTNPADSSTSGVLTFTNEIINEGGGFDIVTGRFICPFGGIYYFNLNLMKIKDTYIKQVSCYIDKNGSITVRAHADPRNDDGVYGVSNSVFLRLEMGDVVTIAGCYERHGRYRQIKAASTMESWSSFSGYMVRPHLLMPRDNASG